jgi:hypothetical protein
MNDKLKPALLGGLVTGILSVIPFISSCCCIWAIMGGGLAGFLYIKSSAKPVETSEGAIVGGMSGAVAAVIYLIIGLPLALLFGASQMEEAFRRSGMEVPLAGAAMAVLGALLVMVLLLVFSVLGGILAVAIFEKRKGELPPAAPPQDFGSGPGGSYGAGL